ncbi:DNA-3-methyladenine glycosylase I [Oleiagrimonas sp. C23AA]|uniref:DNA-3-methyladenine glycosylase I n=1 Tax=Oleiagrimonas sp. C23AA TaxID=2719047 RepID=UPI0031B733A8
MVTGADCAWPLHRAIERDYHDAEWGVPEHDDRALFELLCLEGQQAGLSWYTVLSKRARYREVFHGFRIDAVAAMEDADVEAALSDAGLIRHRAKLFAIRDNARAAQALIARHGSLDAFVWSFVDGAPRQNRFRQASQIPAQTDASRALSRALKREGFRFVGPTTCYAFMQAAGLVNDHLAGCPRQASLGG